MLFAFVMLAMFFWLDPNLRSVVDSAANQAEGMVNAQLPLFFAVVALTLVATAISWFMTNWPKRQPRSHFRVVKRYWVQQ